MTAQHAELRDNFEDRHDITGEGETLLHFAILRSPKTALKIAATCSRSFINKSYDGPRYKDETALHLAAMVCAPSDALTGETGLEDLDTKLTLLTVLLLRGAKLNQLARGGEFRNDSQNRGSLYNGQTVLQFAACTGNLDVVRLIVDSVRWVKPDDANDSGWTEIPEKFEDIAPKIVYLGKEKAQEVNQATRALITQTDQYGHNVFHVLAVQKNANPQIVNYLKEVLANADPSYLSGLKGTDNASGGSVKEGSTHSAKVSNAVTKRSHRGLTPCQLGAFKGNPHALDMLRLNQWRFGNTSASLVRVDRVILMTKPPPVQDQSPDESAPDSSRQDDSSNFNSSSAHIRYFESNSEQGHMCSSPVPFNSESTRGSRKQVKFGVRRTDVVNGGGGDAPRPRHPEEVAAELMIRPVYSQFLEVNDEVRYNPHHAHNPATTVTGSVTQPLTGIERNSHLSDNLNEFQQSSYQVLGGDRAAESSHGHVHQHLLYAPTIPLEASIHPVGPGNSTGPQQQPSFPPPAIIETSPDDGDDEAPPALVSAAFQLTDTPSEISTNQSHRGSLQPPELGLRPDSPAGMSAATGMPIANTLPSPWSKMSPLQIAVEMHRQDVLCHPLMFSMVLIKWHLYARRIFLFSFLRSSAAIILFTIALALQPADPYSRANYTNMGSRSRLAFEAITTAFCLLYGRSAFIQYRRLMKVAITKDTTSGGPGYSQPLKSSPYHDLEERMVRRRRINRPFEYYGFPVFLGLFAVIVVVRISLVLRASRVLMVTRIDTAPADANPADDVVVDMVQLENALMSLASVIGWLAMLYFTKAFQNLGPLYIAFKRAILNDLRSWSFLYLTLLMGFSSAFFLQKNGFHDPSGNGPSGNGTDTGDGSDILPPYWDSWPGAVVTTFRTLFQQTDFDRFSNASSEPVAHVFYIVYTLFTLVLVLNILIAKLSQSFTTIAEDALKIWRVQFASLIVESDYLLGESDRMLYSENIGHRDPTDKSGRYITFIERGPASPDSKYKDHEILKVIVAFESPDGKLWTDPSHDAASAGARSHPSGRSANQGLPIEIDLRPGLWYKWHYSLLGPKLVEILFTEDKSVPAPTLFAHKLSRVVALAWCSLLALLAPGFARSRQQGTASKDLRASTPFDDGLDAFGDSDPRGPPSDPENGRTGDSAADCCGKTGVENLWARHYLRVDMSGAKVDEDDPGFFLMT
ncbi:hypothetical protein DFJ73DRAFT_584641 [Zopfochytrium polystomum]|nr:hypothetical protein DFJ73DRAFT_584641 [Zopfochytrium polystomum]